MLYDHEVICFLISMFLWFYCINGIIMWLAKIAWKMSQYIYIFEVVTMLRNDMPLPYLPLFLDGSLVYVILWKPLTIEEGDIFLNGKNHNQYQSWKLWVRLTSIYKG